MVKKASREGFTLVELSFAMVFISLLSLAIVLIIINTISSYRRGITLTEVNSVGTQLIDELRVAIQNSSTKSVEDLCKMNYSKDIEIETCKKSGAYYYRRETASIKMPGKNTDTTGLPVYGAFCTGTYSYVWNSGYYYMDGAEVKKAKASVSYKDENGVERSIEDYRFLRIKDETRQICIKGVTNNVFDIKDGAYISEEPEEMLASSNMNNLAVYDLKVAKPAEGASKNNLFYSGWIILGTTTGGPSINSGTKCAKPDDAEANFDFCAINRFSFAAQASGEK